MRRRNSIRDDTSSNPSSQSNSSICSNNEFMNGGDHYDSSPPLQSSSFSSSPSLNTKKDFGYSSSRFSYYTRDLTKAKTSNLNLQSMISSSTCEHGNILPHCTYMSKKNQSLTEHIIKPTVKTKNPKTDTLYKIILFIIPVIITATLIFFTKREHTRPSFEHLHSKFPLNIGSTTHKSIPHEINIKLPSKTTRELDDHGDTASSVQHLQQNLSQRKSRSSNDGVKIRGGIKAQSSSKDRDLITNKNTDEQINSMILDSPKKFFFATSSTSSMNGGYAELPFPIYCPSEISNTQDKTPIGTCEYAPIAWSTSLWIYPLQSDDDHQSSYSKRVILSNHILELYLNNSSQLTLNFFHSSSLISTDMRIFFNKWTHIGVSMVPTISDHGDSTGNIKNIKIKLFVDGKDQVSDEISKNFEEKFYDSDRTRIGQDYRNDNAFEGYLAMMAIWSNSRDYNASGGTIEYDNSVKSGDLAGKKAIFRDDYMMKSAYRVGLDERELFYLEQHGLVKSPNFLYPLRVIPLKNDANEQPLVSLLTEKIHRLHGALFQPNLLLHPQPFIPAGPLSYIEYINGNNTPPEPSQLEQYQHDIVARLRRIHVRNAMKHVWRGYKTYAYGQDELKPISKRGHDNWGGMCTTLIDSLDTLWMMGMKKEFWEGRNWIRDHLDFDKVTRPISVFETTIRNLGGLLSAYDLSGDRVFLDKAEDLGERMLQSFDSPSGLPFSETDLNEDRSFNTKWLNGKAILSELGTLQLEFRFLGKVTGKKKFSEKVTRAFDTLIKMNPKRGLYPVYIKNELDRPEFGSDQISIGALGDSFYEYLLKVWLQGGKRENSYRRMYDKAIDGIINHLLQKSAVNGLTYISELAGEKVVKKMDHLVCFLPGTLALGAFTDPNGVDSSRAKRDMRVAKSLAYTCYQMYASTRSGMASELVEFKSKNVDFTVSRNAPFNILRPETVESLYVLHQLTGDNVYREWGWQIFRAIEEFCKTEAGYGSLLDVNDPDLGVEDRMESFFLAETLKYLYLLQDPESSLDIINKHVLNTEAHPIRMFDELDRNEKKSFFPGF